MASPAFPAAYRGRCFECGELVEIGDLVQVVDTELVHEDCNPELLGDDLDVCRPVEVDGEIIRVHGATEMTNEDRRHFTELVRAIKARMQAEEDQTPTQQGEPST